MFSGDGRSPASRLDPALQALELSHGDLPVPVEEVGDELLDAGDAGLLGGTVGEAVGELNDVLEV